MLSETCVVTPANDIVELHPTVLADVDGHHLAPEEEALHQHPGEGGHEEEMEQGGHDVARDLHIETSVNSGTDISGFFGGGRGTFLENVWGRVEEGKAE